MFFRTIVGTYGSSAVPFSLLFSIFVSRYVFSWVRLLARSASRGYDSWHDQLLLSTTPGTIRLPTQHILSWRGTTSPGFDSWRDTTPPGYDSWRDTTPGHDSWTQLPVRHTLPERLLVRRDFSRYDSWRDTTAPGHDSRRNTTPPGHDSSYDLDTTRGFAYYSWI